MSRPSCYAWPVIAAVSSPCAASTAVLAFSAFVRAPLKASSIRFFRASIVLSNDANSAATLCFSMIAGSEVQLAR